MTSGADVHGVGETSAPERDRPPGPRRFWTRTLVLGVLVAAWLGAAALERGRTSLFLVEPPACTGSNLAEGGAMRMVPGMDCRVVVRVEHRGWSPVRVEQVRLSLMGPDGGAGVQVERLDGEPAAADELDAVFRRAHTLRAGEGRDLDLVFSFRPEGCSSEGGTGAVELPTVRVRALGVSGTLEAPYRASFRGTRASSCDGPGGPDPRADP